MNSKTKDNLNGVGVILSFITPLLVGLILFILNSMNADIKDLKTDMKNHLNYHKQLELRLENRLTNLETLIKDLRRNYDSDQSLE
jgi:hypothetical protein